MSILANLPLEILLSIVDLLSAEDFVKFSRSSKEFHDNRLLKKYAWLGYFGRKWELSDNEAKKMKNLSSNLYPLCHPLGSAVFSNMNVGLKCSKNIALFLGLVGAGKFINFYLLCFIYFTYCRICIFIFIIVGDVFYNI